MAAEQQGDFRKAEASLFEAPRLDTGFAPRWALSDFYFRRRDAEKFWPGGESRVGHVIRRRFGPVPQCWTLSSDAQTILKRAIPDRPAVLRQYLDFLLNERRLDAAEPVADKVLARADEGCLTVPAATIATICSRQVATSMPVIVWNGLSEAQVDSLCGTRPGRGEDAPVNGDFRLPGPGRPDSTGEVSSPDGI